jgi:hypothetical protein
MYWINCLYLEPLNNYEAWGLPVQRWRSDQWATTATYERMLDALWINGAQGAMFWLLSKSDSTAFELAKKVSKEAYLASEYLMEPDAGIAATITSTEGDETAQFILRRHPDYPNKVLIMICNNTDEVAYIWVYFPQDCEIQQVEQLIPAYQWSYIVYADRFSVGMGPWTARAFILNVIED